MKDFILLIPDKVRWEVFVRTSGGGSPLVGCITSLQGFRSDSKGGKMVLGGSGV